MAPHVGGSSTGWPAPYPAEPFLQAVEVVEVVAEQRRAAKRSAASSGPCWVAHGSAAFLMGSPAAAGFTGQPSPAPLVVGSADGLFLIVLAHPAIHAPAADQQAADDHTLPDCFLPLVTLTPSDRRPMRDN